jgi:hypothetical protein
MSRLYTASFKAVAVTVQQDFFEILAATNKPVRIHAWNLAQSTEIGDAMEEGLLLTCNRGAGTVATGTGGTTPVQSPLCVDDATGAAVVEANNTTKMAVGTGVLTELETHVWNVRIPYLMIYPPEMRPYIRSGDRWTLELETTPADSITISGTVWFEEIS